MSRHYKICKLLAAVAISGSTLTPMVAQEVDTQPRPAIETQGNMKRYTPANMGLSGNENLLQVLGYAYDGQDAERLNSYTLLIDGKPTELSAVSYLQITKAVEVVCVEVSTFPIASYGLSGSNGTINVVRTQVDVKVHTEGMLQAQSATNGAHNAIASLSLHGSRVDFSALLSSDWSHKHQEQDTYVYTDSGNGIQSFDGRYNKIKNRSWLQTAKLSTDWRITDHDLLKAYYLESYQDKYKDRADVDRYLLTLNNGTSNRSSKGYYFDEYTPRSVTHAVSAAYTHSFHTAGREFTVGAYWNLCRDWNDTYFEEGRESLNFHNNVKQKNQLWNVSARYATPLTSHLSLGMSVYAKWARLHNWDDTYGDFFPALLQRACNKSVYYDHFQFIPTIDLKYTYGGLTISGNLQSDTYQDKIDNVQETVSDNLWVYDVMVGYKFSESHSINAIASRRATHMNFDQLVPDVRFSYDKFTVGNWDLKPSIFQNYNLSYDFRSPAGVWTTSLQYAYQRSDNNVWGSISNFNPTEYGLKTQPWFDLLVRSYTQYDYTSHQFSAAVTYQKGIFAITLDAMYSEGHNYSDNWMVRMVPKFTLPAQWTISADCIYDGGSSNWKLRFDPVFNLKFVVAKELGKHWNLTLTGSELTNRKSGLVIDINDSMNFQVHTTNRHVAINLGATYKF